MYAILFTLFLLRAAAPQTPPPASATFVNATTQQQALTAALIGRWTGVLEYRDYSEPPASTKRVQLPTWLTINSAAEGLSIDYVYDDGPAKTVTEHDTLALDLAQSHYRVTGSHSVEQYAIVGLEALKEGHGTLTLTGPGTDNDKPADIRTTWTIRRNLLSWLEEVRPSGSDQPFTFRHRYTFTRAEAPHASN